MISLYPNLRFSLCQDEMRLRYMPKSGGRHDPRWLGQPSPGYSNSRTLPSVVARGQVDSPHPPPESPALPQISRV
eukprot:scaffold103810_cov63-Phaeocystis_antarctica.AAC.2